MAYQSFKNKRIFFTKTVIIFCLLFFVQNSQAQKPEIFLKSQTLTLTAIDTLNPMVNETSGLIYFDGTLWTHNDSGKKPMLYKIDEKTGNILQSVLFLGITCVDWEDIAQDENYLYIGDVGNNVSGNRTDLVVYKVAKQKLLTTTNDTIEAKDIEKIFFSYADQVIAPSQGNNKTAYDCEAMAYINGALHLFTKNWLKPETSHYILPTQAGTYSLEKQETYPLTGKEMITGADYLNGKLCLLGYSYPIPPLVFLLSFQNLDKNSSLLNASVEKYSLGSTLELGQAEGFCFKDSIHTFLSNEETANASLGLRIPATLYSIVFEETATAINRVDLYEETVFIKAADEKIIISAKDGNKLEKVIIFDNVGRLQYKKENINTEELCVSKNGISGFLIFNIQTSKGVFVKKVFIK